MKLNNHTYDTLKYIALIALPALQVFWLTVGKIWDLAYTVEIGATIGAIALLLGTLLGVSTSNYRAEKIQDNFNFDGVEMFDGVDTSFNEGDNNEDKTNAAE